MVKIDDVSFAEVWRNAQQSRSRHMRSWFAQQSRVVADRLTEWLVRTPALLAATKVSRLLKSSRV